jgi:hypothetical protein|tara:strand:- start:184 stop:417 length:234 start_codon:yes stop_codon:yes gene_type:complete
VAVFVIVTLFVASFGATLLVMLCVVLVDVDILGLMWLWGLSIDSVGYLAITHCSPYLAITPLLSVDSVAITNLLPTY